MLVNAVVSVSVCPLKHCFTLPDEELMPHRFGVADP